MTDYEDEDPFVPVWEGPTPQAAELLQRIEAARIPVDLGEALAVGHARVEVPRSYVEDAKDVLAGTNANWPEVTVLTATGFDWKPRIWLALIAVLLILMLVITVVAT